MSADTVYQPFSKHEESTVGPADQNGFKFSAAWLGWRYLSVRFFTSYHQELMISALDYQLQFMVLVWFIFRHKNGLALSIKVHYSWEKNLSNMKGEETHYFLWILVSLISVPFLPVLPGTLPKLCSFHMKLEFHYVFEVVLELISWNNIHIYFSNIFPKVVFAWNEPG